MVSILFIPSSKTVAECTYTGFSICGSGSFVISAAKVDPRIKAIATASMYDMGDVNRNGLQDVQSLDQRNEVVAGLRSTVLKRSIPVALFRILPQTRPPSSASSTTSTAPHGAGSCPMGRYLLLRRTQPCRATPSS